MGTISRLRVWTTSVKQMLLLIVPIMYLSDRREPATPGDITGIRTALTSLAVSGAGAEVARRRAGHNLRNDGGRVFARF
jgi:hypothetical protein